ncbi:hypothetical protein FD723_38325 (plasmid) [Nostoc sp. C052]|uniref:hypothetical protein n=1 Tax=Nostoc sp. C052 TaxID=2576902 RepID=UPI0015C37D49|nr:hypothetical protein [Nostoc sp. C052]QLE46058.1 hypothetical protein FD723_38325 [Nostoc sp. C052]
MAVTDVLLSEENDVIDALDESVLATPKVPQDKKSFAAMNGVTFEIEFSDREEVNEPQTQPQPEELVTTQVISQHPLLKAGVIGSVIFLLIAVAGGMINTSMDALSNSTTVKPEAIKQGVSGKAQDLESQSENPGKIKTALAITSQKPELESLRNTSRSKALVKEENTVVKSSPVTASTGSPPIVSPPSQRQYASISPSPPIVIPPNPTRYREPLATKSFSTLLPRPRPQSIALVSSSSNKPNLDPMEQWLAVSNVGSFSANSTDITANQPIIMQGISGGTGTPKSVTKSAVNVNEQTLINESGNIDYNAKRVIVGTRTQGKIETPIAISAVNANQVQKYLIRLTSPLKASDGSEVLPIDSYLVVAPASNSGEYIQMSAITALINVDGQTLEKTIPENSIIILNKNGEALRGESHQGSSLGNNFMTAVIAGVSKAAEVENNPNSQTTISSSGFSTSTVSNDKKNLLAGFAQGSFSQVLQSIQSSNTQQIQSLQSNSKVFVVPAQTTVQIFVNQTISL